MDDEPLLGICLLTYKRTPEAIATINSTCDFLGYPQELRRWYIADDGSEKEHVGALLNVLRGRNEQIIGWHNEKFSQQEFCCGIGWNKGLGICYQHSDYVLVLEDDWKLEAELDVQPYVKLLREKEDVGIVSFRILSVGADVHTVGYDGIMYLRYKRTTQYAYSGNPHIRHARYTKYYGWYAEDRNPGLIELDQDDHYRLDVGGGPEIWRPATLDQWGGWHHIGEKVWH